MKKPACAAGQQKMIQEPGQRFSDSFSIKCELYHFLCTTVKWMDLLECMEVVCLSFSYKRYWELRSVVGETLSACGVSRAVLDELLAMNRIMPHNGVGTGNGTVLPTNANEEHTN